MNSDHQSFSIGGYRRYQLVLVGLVICFGCPAYVAYRMMWADPRDKAGMNAAATSYLDAIRDGKPPAAYAWVCDQIKKEYPLSRWLSRHDYPQGIKSYQITNTDIIDHTSGSEPDWKEYRLDAEIHSSDGRIWTWHSQMTHNKAGWRVC